MITVVLHPRALGHKGSRYDVELDGALIVTGSLDPEYDAARAMLERGLSGPFRTITPAGQTRMRFPSIEMAARLTMQESDRGRLRAVPYKPYSPRGRSTKGGLESEAGTLPREH